MKGVLSELQKHVQPFELNEAIKRRGGMVTQLKRSLLRLRVLQK